MSSSEKYLDRWANLGKHIAQDLIQLSHYRQSFEAFSRMVRRNEKLLADPGRFFLCYIRDWYATEISLAIRRNVDKGKKSISLRVLLHSMSKHASQYEPGTIRGLFPIDEFGKDIVQDLFVRVEQKKMSQPKLDLDVAYLEAAIEWLDDKTLWIKERVDKHLAHREIGYKPTVELVYDDLTAVAQRIENLSKPILTLVTGVNQRFEVIDQFDWLEMFDYSWRNR